MFVVRKKSRERPCSGLGSRKKEKSGHSARRAFRSKDEGQSERAEEDNRKVRRTRAHRRFCRFKTGLM